MGSRDDEGNTCAIGKIDEAPRPGRHLPRMRRAILFASCLLLAATPASAVPESAPRAIERADPLRRILLDALRPEVERDLGQKLIFVVDLLRVQDGWAFATLAPRTPAGAQIDFSRTRHAERQREGMLDGDTIHALLRWTGGKWKIVTWVIGPTDVAWAGWPEEHGAPQSLFGLPEGD